MLTPELKNKMLTLVSKGKPLRASEYAKLRGITTQAVIQAIRNGYKMPGVDKVEKVAGYYVVYLAKDASL